MRPALLALLLAGLSLSACYESHGAAALPPPDAGAPVVRPRWRGIESGHFFTCAIGFDRRTFCWGHNGSGQLGIGGGEREIFAPRQVQTDAAFVQLSAGSSHICGVTAEGELLCWGSNVNLALGTGDDENRDRPTRLTLPPIAAVAAGGFHTCALTELGEVLCWGDNARGQSGVEDMRRVPAAGRPVLDGVSAIALGGSHSCALRDDGVWCWGGSGRGELGDGGGSGDDGAGRARPEPVPGTADAVAIFAGGATSCALLGGGAPLCWGANDYGQVGDGGEVDRPRPTPGSALPAEVVALTYGPHNHACLLGGDQRVRCWGFGGSGRLGDGTMDDHLTPVEPLDLPNAAAVSTGQGHACALTLGDRIFCWGLNLSGQLGVGPEGARPFPAEVVFE